MLTLAGSAATLSGCAMVPPNSFLDQTKVGRFPLTYQESGIRRALTPKESPGGIAGATSPTPDDLVVDSVEYRLGPYDQIAMAINDLVEPGQIWTSAQEVTPSGYIRIPELGLIRVTGLSEIELEQELANRLREAEKLPNPIVQVVIQVKRNTIFSIIGDVREPGVYPITQPDTRLLDIIPLARDIGPNVRRLYIIRKLDRGPARGTTPTGQPTDGADPLVIPPPDDDGMPGSFSAGWGPRAETRVAAQQTPSREELDQIASPTAAPAAPAESDPAPRPRQETVPPLIYDPATGQMIEARPAYESPAAPTLPQNSGASFRWEDVPEIELSQRVIEVDVAALMRGDPSQNIVIRDRDVVRVPIDTGLFYLMGEVNRPGVFGFNGREITLKQALGSVGGGFSPLAWPQRCEIIRRDKGSDKQITIPVNMDAIYAGLQDDILLQDDDLVNVGTHTLAPFLFVIRNSFRFTYGFGFVYDRNFADQDQYGPRLNPETRRDAQRATRGLPF